MAAKDNPFTIFAAQVYGHTTGEDTVQRLKEGKCPFCGKVPDVSEFRDKLSRDEFARSGLCMTCQDVTFKDE